MLSPARPERRSSDLRRRCPAGRGQGTLARLGRSVGALTCSLLACSVVLPALAQAAAQAQGTVVLLRPALASEELAEATLRIKSELAANGFHVVIVENEEADLGQQPQAHMERAADGLTPAAIIAVGALGRGSAELWVVDRITGKTVMHRLNVEASPDRRISEVLAIRAQELLRASLVERALYDGQSPAPTQAPRPAPVLEQVRRAVADAPAAPLARWSFGAEVGVATLSGAGGIDTAVAPAGRLGMGLGERLWLRASAVGFGSRPRVGADTGSARVRQDVFLAEVATFLRPHRRLRPSFSLGAGAERVQVDGSAGGPYRGERNARWFLAGDVSLGLLWRVQAHWEVHAEVHALCAVPRPAVRFFDVEAAKAGEPTILALLTLAVGT